MMKKLIFCLLTLAGTGALSSCQQDEVANEVIENKGVTIRASLPGDDARSRVILGETTGENTDVLWEEDDVITLTIGSDTYTFSITSGMGTTNAEFTCVDAPETLGAGTYTFTYGSSELQTEQAGTKEALSDYHYMTAEYTATEAIAWEEVNLTFETQVAIVEITLPDDVTASEVSLYNAADFAVIATTTGGAAFEGKVYFAVAPGTYEGLVVAETADKVAYKMLSSKELKKGNLYRISGLTTANGNAISNTSLKQVISNGTLIVYGSGGIPEKTFQKSSLSFTRAIILEGITSIGKYAFQGCSSLASVTIPASVTSIGNNAFQGCSSLISVIIPEGVTSIGNSVFQGCSSLASVIIPEGVTSIGNSVFYGCRKLASVTIPASVTSIGGEAFKNCQILTSVTCLATKPPTLGSDVFALVSTNKCKIYVPSESVEEYKNASGWKSFNIQAISTSEP